MATLTFECPAKSPPPSKSTRSPQRSFPPIHRDRLVHYTPLVGQVRAWLFYEASVERPPDAMKAA
jgi:hypothetical protein